MVLLEHWIVLAPWMANWLLVDVNRTVPPGVPSEQGATTAPVTQMVVAEADVAPIQATSMSAITTARPIVL
jgi:hypothetical protein